MSTDSGVVTAAGLPLRIAFLGPAAQLGGAERSLLDQASSLCDSGRPVECHLILPLNGPLEDAARRLGIIVHHVPMPPSLLRVGDSRAGNVGRFKRVAGWMSSLPPLIGYLRRLRAALAQIRPDIVHSNGLKTHIVSALTYPRTALLGWHMHDFLSNRPLAARLLRFLASRVTVILPVSEAVAADVRRVLPGTRVLTVLNAIDIHHFSPGPSDGAWLDRLAGFEPAAEGVIRVGIVATYARWKGQDTFLRAIAEMTDQAGPAIRFFVVGGAIYDTAGSQFSEADLRGLAADLGIASRVGFAPFQADPLPVYRALDVLVHASSKPEPFGRTIAEAMACGRAVIVSRAGGAVELYEEGVDAVGFSPGDASALAAQVGRLATEGAFRSSISARAREAAVRKFDRSRLASQFLAAYRL